MWWLLFAVDTIWYPWGRAKPGPDWEVFSQWGIFLKEKVSDEASWRALDVLGSPGNDGAAVHFLHVLHFPVLSGKPLCETQVEVSPHFPSLAGLV